MPNGDGTGPCGGGQMRGRAAGFCNNSGISEKVNSGIRGSGRHRGTGCDNSTAKPLSIENETDFLQQKIQHLESNLDIMKDRLSQVQKNQKESKE